MKMRDTLTITKNGHLTIGGCDAAELVKEFGTPLYAMDEAYLMHTATRMRHALTEKYPNSLVCYASKAFSCTAIYQMFSLLGLGADVASGGELYTAVKAGMDPARLYFHGNNKLSKELTAALDANVHAVVIDSLYEIQLLNELCGARHQRQGVLIRVNPGIDAHTHHFIQTARVDSKFGFSIADGAALTAVKEILKQPNLEFLGIHCHIGSQIFEVMPFTLAVDKMTDFMVVLSKACGVEVRELNMGGGYGVTYTQEDKPLEPEDYIGAIADKLTACIAQKALNTPKLIIEPGRSLVGEAGITLYSIGAIKEIEGIKKYISVDGGMFENPRCALYDAKYEAVLALRALESGTETVTVAGKCCESGDILAKDILLPRAKSGEILAIFTTGAYHYSMASNYNRNVVPPVVLCKNGKARYMIKPQSYADIVSRDVKYKLD